MNIPPYTQVIHDMLLALLNILPVYMKPDDVVGTMLIIFVVLVFLKKAKHLTPGGAAKEPAQACEPCSPPAPASPTPSSNDARVSTSAQHAGRDIYNIYCPIYYPASPAKQLPETPFPDHLSPYDLARYFTPDTERMKSPCSSPFYAETARSASGQLVLTADSENTRPPAAPHSGKCGENPMSHSAHNS